MHNAILYFLKCLCLSPLGFKKEKLIITELFNKFSYRYTEIEQKSLLSPIRYLKTALFLLWKKNESPSNYGKDSFTYDLLTQFYEGDYDYLKALGEENTEFIFRENLYNECSFFSKLLNTVLLLVVFIILAPVLFLKKDKAQASLILLELIETELLGTLLYHKKCKTLLIFSAFEKDIIFLSSFLIHHSSIKVSLLPSSNPISTLYKNVICTTFIFSSPYQKTEYEKLKENWFIENTKLWPPYGFNSINLNKPENEAAQHIVGIISSGMALREHLKHPSEYSKNDFLAEADMVKGIQTLFQEGLINMPIIYLHPLERLNQEHLNFSTNYYRFIFGNEVKFSPFDKASKSFFNLCNIGISVYSSTQTERLFGGYKTVFAPMGHLKNFFPEGTFETISVQNFDELKKMVLTLKEISDETYFKNYHLEAYRWDAYIQKK